MTTAPDLAGWLPIHIKQTAAGPLVEWCRLAGLRFTEPFFEGTLQVAMRDPFNHLFRQRTTLDTLLQWTEDRPGLEPSGFIFHMSRCGSTLAARMLALVPENIVLSEPPPLDFLLRLDQHGATDEQRIALLRGWMRAISQPVHGEKRLFVKLDAWHIFDLPLLRRAFPDTPWVFLHRNPVEVMVSAARSPGLHMLKNWLGNRLANLDAAEIAQMTQAGYTARVLAAFLNAALDHLVSFGGKAIDYGDLPEAVITEIAPYFGLPLSDADLDLMRAQTEFNAKTPSMYFEPDVASKLAAADDETRSLCAEHLDPLHRRLREL